MLVNSLFPFGLKVSWAKPEQFSSLDANIQDWLLNTDSLTERLQSLCSHFEVKVLGQSVLALDLTERQALPEHHLQSWQIREVILYGNGQPWVFARSVLPNHLCESAWADLGNQPLGQRIFNDPRFVRSDFEIGSLQTHPITNVTLKVGEHLHSFWARRSVFTMEQDTLLVAEAFLPDCPCYKVTQ